ncbi:hypothetical protein BGX27_009134 [Mortierella sp. AM989]|nr:hypothetical protein BGX27_009134 [Mortierella sp. AM989]
MAQPNFQTYSVIRLCPNFRHKEKGVCTSQECHQAATGILRDMQPTADPCVDFDQYTCGGFYEREEISDDGFIVNHASILQRKNLELIRAIATPGDPRSPKIPANDRVGRRNIKKIQNNYASCMDEALLDEIGRQPLVDDIRKLTQLYHVENSDLFKHSSVKRAILPEADRHTLSTVIGQSLGRGSESFIAFEVNPYSQDPNLMLLTIKSAGPDPSTGPSSNPNATAFYQNMVGEMFTVILGEDNTTNGTIQVPEAWASVAKDVVEFETSLSQAITKGGVNTELDTPDIVLTFDELVQRTPSLDWGVILKNALPKNVKIPEKFTVISPGYLNELNAFLEKTSRKTLQNYFAWVLIRENSISLGLPYRKPITDYKLAVSGVPKGPTRSEYCLTETSGGLPDLVGHYFLEATFTEKIGTKVQEMIDNIRAVYLRSFETYDWLDSFTRKGALEKIKAIAEKIGYSMSGPNVESLPSVDVFYRKLTIRSEDHYGNQARISTFMVQNMLRALNFPLDRKHMYQSPQTIDAFYYPLMNDINIMAGVMASPYFDVDYPEYMSYGALGSVVGHEFTHAFDNRGRKYDAAGRLRNWWSNSSIEAFETRSQCFVNEYSNFTIKGLDNQDHAVDGNLTLGENIADNGGIKKSFETWLALYKSDPASLKYNNKRLPGLEKHTPEQIFFIQWGRAWCAEYRPEIYSNLLADVHSPPKWRINGIARNSEYFAQAFKCKPGTPMNPINKCDLW